MKTPTTFTLLALVALSWSGSPVRADDETTRNELQGIYNQVCEGVKKKEPTPGAAFVSPDFKELDIFGKLLTADQVRARLKENLDRTDSIASLNASVLRVRSRGDLALALVRTTASATIKGKDGKPHKLDSSGVSLHLWKKEGDSWKIRFADQVALRQTVDGKLLTPPARKRARPAKPGGTGALAGPSAWIPAAQWYYTPYNYGWGGYGSYYGYGWGYNTAASNYQNIVGGYMMAHRGEQKAIYKQQKQYEAYMKLRKKYQKQLAELQKQQQQAMQQYMQQYQQSGQVPGQGQGAAAGGGGQ
jgi:ketosteroid isomerase-like protein